MPTDNDVGILRETLRKMSRGRTSLNPKGIQSRLLSKTGLDSTKLKMSMRVLQVAEEVFAEGWDQYHGMPITQLRLNLAPEVHPPHVLEWFEAVKASPFEVEAKKALAMPTVADKFKDMSWEWKARLLWDLHAFRMIHEDLPPGTTVYKASARHVLGSSKVLGYFGGTLLKSIGIDLTHLSKGPRYLAVAGPPEPEAVILVENPHSFEMAVGARTGCAWACTYGFGLSLDKDERQMLVENLTTHLSSLEILVRDGKPPSIIELLRNERLFFWGDLDLAGMMIYSQLKSSFPQIRLSGIYTPMLRKMTENGGHPYVRCTGKEGQRKTFKIIDSLVETILSHCLECGLDQEAVSIDEIEKYACLELDMS